MPEPSTEPDSPTEPSTTQGTTDRAVGSSGILDLVVDRVLLLAAFVGVSFAAIEFGSRADALRAKYGFAAVMFVAALHAGVVLAIVALGASRRSSPPPAAANLRTTFALTILLAIAGIVTAPAWTRLGSIGLFGVIGAANAARTAIREFFRSIAASRFTRAASFAAFQLALAVVLAECTMRAFASIRPTPLLARSDSSAAASVEHNRYRPGFVRFGYPANSLGFFDEEIGSRRDGERRILLVGDSFVVGIVPHYFHFSTVCEREIGANVIAAGVPGIGPFEYAYLLENDVADVDADEIVVAIFVGNDLVEAEYGFQPRNWRSSWLDRRNLLVFEAPRRLRILRRESALRGIAAGTIAGETEDIAFDPRDPIALERQFPWLADYRLEVDGHSEQAFLQIESNRILGACRVDAAPPLAIFEALRRIRAAVRGERLTILLLPDEFQVDDVLYQRVIAEFRDERFERDRPQRILTDFCADEGIPVIDALPALRAAPREEDGRPHVYHRFDTHLNRKGNEIVGKALAEYLRSR